MKKVFQFLRFAMDQEAARIEIKKIVSKYPENSNDEDISKVDLEALIKQLEIIIKTNNGMNVQNAEDEECLKKLKFELENKCTS